MDQARPASRGSSIFSETTYGRLEPRTPSPERRIILRWPTPPPLPPPSATNHQVESPVPDSSSWWSQEDAENEFEGAADSTSWWNYEDSVSQGPADSTTP